MSTGLPHKLTGICTNFYAKKMKRGPLFVQRLDHGSRGWCYLADNGHRKEFALFTTYIGRYTNISRMPRGNSTQDAS